MAINISDYSKVVSLTIADLMLERIANAGVCKLDVKKGKPHISPQVLYEYVYSLIHPTKLLERRIFFPIYKSEKSRISKFVLKIFNVKDAEEKNIIFDRIGYCRVNYFIKNDVDISPQHLFKIKLDLKCSREVYLSISDVYDTNYEKVKN